VIARADEALAVAAQGGDCDSERELVERHRGLLVVMIRKDLHAPSHTVFDALVAAGEGGFRRAVSTWRPDTGVPVRLWMRKVARWAMADAARAARRETERAEGLAEMWPPWPTFDLVAARIAALPGGRVVRAVAAERLTPWVDSKPTQAELAARLGVPQQQISRLERRARRALAEANVMWWRKKTDAVPGIVKCYRAPAPEPMATARSPRPRIVEMTEEEKATVRAWLASLDDRRRLRPGLTPTRRRRIAEPKAAA
jgi:transcriptional regulator with XRE-family HTH domain